MNIRIIAGTFGGRVIEGSATNRTHPMSERVRGSLFNIIGDELAGARVLDAFAGSGSLGLEALSRGAKEAVFVESDRVAGNVIGENVAALGVANSTTIVKSTVSQFIQHYEGDSFDIIFADPPYHDLQLSTVFNLTKLLAPNGLMVLSYPGRGETPSETRVVVVDSRSYGNAALAFYRLKSAL